MPLSASQKKPIAAGAAILVDLIAGRCSSVAGRRYFSQFLSAGWVGYELLLTVLSHSRRIRAVSWTWHFYKWD